MGTHTASLPALATGGVAVSGLEMTQDRLGLQWSEEEVRCGSAAWRLLLFVAHHLLCKQVSVCHAVHCIY